eukprot:6479746-Amphidinium_carterae.1
MPTLRELLIHGNPLLTVDESIEQSQLVLAQLDSLEYLDDQRVPEKSEAQKALTDPTLTEEEQTFRLTHANVASGEAPAGGTSRPSTARPSTAGSRPGTASAMKDAGVKDPLMHARLKILGEKRFATEEQTKQWEQQTLSSLAAIEKQIEKTVEQAEGELAEMNRYMERAEMVLQREKAG